MGTFADLMSLLMCFFVLLLAFSEMDAQKYKQVAGSMAKAFGVQNEIKKKDIPRGTSIIAQEFSPGRPDPTPLNVVQQKTTDVTKSSLDVFCEEGTDVKSDQGSSAASTLMVIDKLKELIQQTESDAVGIASEMKDEIQSGQIEVETKGQEIVIRVRENGSFSSGSDKLQEAFIPIMARIREVLVETPGLISVEGHSDSIPIRTARFRSNWDLSAARAVSVAHELMLDELLDKSRISVSGFADSRPLVAEETPENRARNRRVEIVISQEEARKPEKELSQDGSMQDINSSVEDRLGEEAVSGSSGEPSRSEADTIFESAEDVFQSQTEAPGPELELEFSDDPEEEDDVSDDELF
jgi:chemotaxis protein MotB